jgi:UDP-N-acetyl-D-mannosaminuronic acid dehydrogenase
MHLHELRDKIESKESKLAVIGLGYVGLPVACAFAEAGFNVVGIERQEARVAQINAGVSPIEGDEPGLADLVRSVASSGRFHATTDYGLLQDRDVILIDVETPVDENYIPRYYALRDVLGSLGPVLRRGALVIVESTIAPGTMQDLVLPLLTESSGLILNEGFYLGNCPERVMPGKLLLNLRTLSRVVGGMTPETANTMVALYQNIVEAELDPVDCVTAELVKTVENAYRDVQIAFANEVALICEAVGGDVWKVRELVNKTPYRNMHLPGAGVGGHCITKDPWLLAYGARDKGIPIQLIPAARAVNNAMPLHMADMVQKALASLGCDMVGSRVLVFGYAYLENSDDTRNSPSETLAARLKFMGSEVVIHDPYVPEYQGDIYQAAEGCDAAVVMVRHREYLDLDLDILKDKLRTPVLVDGRGVVDRHAGQQAGLTIRSVGVKDKTQV